MGREGICSLYLRVKIKVIKYTSTCPEIMKYDESFLKSGILLSGAANVNMENEHGSQIHGGLIQIRCSFSKRDGNFGFHVDVFRGVSRVFFFKFTLWVFPKIVVPPNHPF